jgi:hypothetical protein
MISVSGYVTLRRWTNGSRRFERTFRLQIQVFKVHGPLTLRPWTMEDEGNTFLGEVGKQASDTVSCRQTIGIKRIYPRMESGNSVRLL